MSKRYGEYNGYNFKKPRLDFSNNTINDLPSTSTNVNDEDLWGEDLDEDEIDECILQASQASQAALSPNAFNTTYSSFKAPQAKFPTSTQISQAPTSSRNILHPPKFIDPRSKGSAVFESNLYNQAVLNTTRSSVSSVQQRNDTIIFKDDKQSNLDLYKELERIKNDNKILKEKLVTKDGEVSILRNQLKQTQKTMENTKMEKVQLIEKQKQEWNEKVSLLNKNLSTIKSELDFKNMELMHLKERCIALESSKVKIVTPVTKSVESSKTNNDFPSTFNSSLREKRVKMTTKDKSSQAENVSNINFNLIPEYPLRKRFPSNLFYQTDQKKYLNTSDKKNFNILYDEKIGVSAKVQEEKSHNVAENPAELYITTSVMANNDHLSFEYISGDLFHLINLSRQELDSNENKKILNKIIYVCEELLLNTFKSIKNLKKTSDKQLVINCEDFFHIEDIPDELSLFSSSSLCESENAIATRQCVAVVSLLVAHTDYISDYVAGVKSLDISNNEFVINNLIYFNDLNEFRRKEENVKFSFIKILHVLCTALIEYKRVNYSAGLLWAIIELLNALLRRNKLKVEGKKIVFTILKMITFSQPPFTILCSITKCFVEASNDEKFLQMFCQNSTKSSLVKNKNIINYNNDSCLLQIFAIQVMNYVHNNTTNIMLALHQAQLLLVFFYNQINILKWYYPQSNHECKCLAYMVQCLVKMLNIGLFNYKRYHSFYTKNNRTSFQIKNVFQNSIPILYLLNLYKYSQIQNISELNRENLEIFLEKKDSLDLDEDSVKKLDEMINILKEDGTVEENIFESVASKKLMDNQINSTLNII